MSLLRLTPRVQHYAWGDSEFIPRLIGQANSDDQPFAELWFGTHPDLPSLVDGAPLGDLLEGELPYLMKVLSAARPLSVQAHPTAEQAREGFARENAAGIPLSAPQRNYRDPRPKPELIVALTDFYALVGFRPLSEIASLLREIPELSQLDPEFEPTTERLRRLYEKIMTLEQSDVDGILEPLLAHLRDQSFGRTHPEHWLVRAANEFWVSGHHDRGLFSVLLLNLVHLHPEQALFLDAGTLHVYLEGSGIEIMSSSNNVLRGGLTGKHVDVAELLRTVRFESARPEVRNRKRLSDTESVYETPASEFELRRIDVTKSRVHVNESSRGPEILLVADADGRVTISSGTERLELAKGGSCVVLAGSSYVVRGKGTLFKAVTPDPEPWFRGRRPVELRFGTSGLRGLVRDITDLEAYVNTRGFLAYLTEGRFIYKGDPVAIASDLRPSSARIVEAVARALVDAGFKVENLGTIPTPALTCYAIQRGRAHIMITGSHIPFDRNGIKFGKPSGEVLKEDEALILAAVSRARRIEYRRPENESLFADDGSVKSRRRLALPPPVDAGANTYTRRYLEFFPKNGLSGRRIAVFQHSAVGRDLLAELLQLLGAEVRAVRRSDAFVPIDTEDITEERLRELQEIGNESPVDAIVSTDGDSDRPLIAGLESDGRVRFFGGDLVGILVADFLRADAVAVPVSVNDAVDIWFEERGVPVTKTKIGSPYVVKAMKDLRESGGYHRVVGWEANGGFMIGSAIEVNGKRLEDLPTRDAVLPILAILHAASERGVSLVELFALLPRRFSKAGLLDEFPQDRSRAVLERFSSLESEQELDRFFSSELGFDGLDRVDRLDGLRLHFHNGDIAHIRPSGNAPQLRIYAVAGSQERADEIVHLAVREPDGILRKLANAASS
ncbi:MAG TPA: mannose-6-phosphate isomerase, class I [Vicinamibacteria bacterium]|nr:mannose-6-phosphate isomerase, class I [Vicinamibacteria bacterium]